MKYKKSVQIYDLQSNCCFTIVTHSLCYGHFSLLLYFFIVDVLIDSVPFLAPVSGPLDGPGSASQDLCHWAVGGDRWLFLCTTRLCDIYICHLFVNTIIHYAAFIILARGCCRQHQIFYRTIQDMLIVVEQANWPFSAWYFYSNVLPFLSLLWYKNVQATAFLPYSFSHDIDFWVFWFLK